MTMASVPVTRTLARLVPPSIVIALVIVTAPKPPGSSASISPPASVLGMAPAKVLQGAVRLPGLASSPTPETHVRVACGVMRYSRCSSSGRKRGARGFRKRFPEVRRIFSSHHHGHRPLRADRAPGWCRAGEGPAWRRNLPGLLPLPFQFRDELLEVLPRAQGGKIVIVLHVRLGQTQRTTQAIPRPSGPCHPASYRRRGQAEAQDRLPRRAGREWHR